MAGGAQSVREVSAVRVMADMVDWRYDLPLEVVVVVARRG